METIGIIRQALGFWHGPALTELPEETITEAANRVFTQHGLDLDLTPDAAFRDAVSAVFSFANSEAREFDLSAVTERLSRVRRVESRAEGGGPDDWTEETIASPDNWNDAQERGDMEMVAFRGTPPNLVLITGRDVSNREFRVTYRQMRDRLTTITADISDLPDLMEPLLVYDLALEFAELIDNRSDEWRRVKGDKTEFLLARRQDAYGRVEKWRRSQRGRSVTTRRAFNDRPGKAFTGRRKVRTQA